MPLPPLPDDSFSTIVPLTGASAPEIRTYLRIVLRRILGDMVLQLREPPQPHVYARPLILW
jgi:hypothetical protein